MQLSGLFQTSEGQVFRRYLQLRLEQAQRSLEMQAADQPCQVALWQGQCKILRQLLSPTFAQDVAEYMKQNG